MSNEIQFLLYNMPNADGKVQVVIKDETLWCTQKAMAQLFGVGVPAISKHLKNIFDEGELDKDVVVSKMEITTQHGAIEEKTQTHKVVFVPLHPLEPAKPLNDAQMCGSFYFYTFPLLRFSYFQTILISL